MRNLRLYPGSIRDWCDVSTLVPSSERVSPVIGKHTHKKFLIGPVPDGIQTKTNIGGHTLDNPLESSPLPYVNVLR